MACCETYHTNLPSILCAAHTLKDTFHTLHTADTADTLHCRHCRVQALHTLCATNCIIHLPHFALHNAECRHCTPNTKNCIFHIPHFALQTLHTLHTLHWTLQSADTGCTTFHTSHSTLHTYCTTVPLVGSEYCSPYIGAMRTMQCNACDIGAMRTMQCNAMQSRSNALNAM